MEVGKLTVRIRHQVNKGETRRMRTSGLVPGVCYGARLDKPLSIVLNAKELKASLDPARGRNTVINVTVEDGKTGNTELTALLWDYQIDALRRNVTHVDLISIDPDKEIEVEVPINLVGKAVGTIDGGQIHVERHTLRVRCRPGSIPARFDLDVTPLKIGDAFHVSNVDMPEGVSAALPEGATLVTCAAPKVEKETTETAAVAEGAAPAEAAAGGKEAAAGGKDAGAKAAPAAKTAAKAGGDAKKK